MIYLDSSALLEWLELRSDQPVVSSELGRVDVLSIPQKCGGMDYEE